jgi:hypothetical protein
VQGGQAGADGGAEQEVQVIAAEISETGQPRPSCRACRNTDGP